MTMMYYFFGRHISFVSFMPITFEIVHTYVATQKTNAYEVLVTVTNILHLAVLSVLLYL